MVCEEVGDLFWYQAILMDAIGTDETEVKNRNLNKLIVRRYGATFSEKAATDRDLSEELKALAEPSTPAPGQVIEYKKRKHYYDKVLNLVYTEDELIDVLYHMNFINVSEGKIYTLINPMIVENGNLTVRFVELPETTMDTYTAYIGN